MKALIPDKTENDSDRESHIFSQLNHPRIPRFIEAFSHDGVDYLVQEFMSGYPLSYYIVNGKRFTEEESKRILFQLLEILAYLHEPEEDRLPSYTGTCVYQTCSGLRIMSIWLISVVPATSTVKRNNRQARPDISDMKMSDRRPGTRTYALFRKEVSPRSDLFGAGVVGLDLFTNWIEDEALFQKPWQEILPASDSFKVLIETLLNQGTQSISAVDVLKRFRA